MIDNKLFKFLLAEISVGQWILSLAIPLLLTVLFIGIFKKQAKAWCGLPTTVCALGITAAGALGLICVFQWFAIVVGESIKEHPIRYRGSILLGLICLTAAFVLLFFYGRERKKKPFFKGVLIDGASVLLFFFPLFRLFLWAISP